MYDQTSTQQYINFFKVNKESAELYLGSLLSGVFIVECEQVLVHWVVKHVSSYM